MVRRRTSNLGMILLVISVLMIGYGGYMSIVDIEYVDTYVPDIPDVIDPVTDTTAIPTRIVYPIKPLPDVRLDVANIFGGDGTINLANIILFIGIALFMISFIVRR